MKLIAFVGFKSSGKNTAAEPLIEAGYVPFSFADALKDALAAIFCWPRNMLEGITEESRQWREEIDEWWANKLEIPEFSPRWAMQNVGTDIMRRYLHNNIWVFNVEKRMMDCPKAVLIDCRFRNEINLAKQYNGKIIRIKRGDDPYWMNIAKMANSGSEFHKGYMKPLGIHESEWSWIGCDIDATIDNNHSRYDLHQEIINLCLED